MDGAVRSIAAWLAPPRCALCTRPCPVSAPLCADCVSALARERGGTAELAGIGRLSWTARYERVARRLVTALKFDGRTALARVAAERIAAVAGSELNDYEAVIPVPAAGSRARRRGFDPAALIATALGREAGLAIASPLIRLDNTRQVGRRRAARVADPPRIRVAAEVPARALIVDDVATTGATLRACAAALRAAGAQTVAAAVFARAL